MKLAIGIITYEKNTAKYLSYFLDSLEKQNYKDFELFVFDNSEDEKNINLEILSQKGVEAKRIGKNIGFAKAYNILISEAVKKDFEYFLVVNPDVLFKPDSIEKLIASLEKDESLGSVCPKLLVWDFESRKKTKIIDSCGIAGISALRFKDLGQGEKDFGQYDKAEIIGPSGAAGLYRISSLEKVKDQFGYFDERIFMYEEDCDLAYRLKIAGFGSGLVPEAIIYHDRTAKAKGSGNFQIALNRKNKSRQVKIWGFRHKHLIFLKHWKGQNFQGKIEISWFAFRMFIYALLFERYLLKEYKKIILLSRGSSNL
jgi:GT2 family glycosyltransferase